MQGPVGQFCQQIAQRRDNIKFQFLSNTGHCAMDDDPEQVHKYLLPWLSKIRSV